MFAQMRDEILHVVALVGAQRLGMDAPAAGASQHRARGTMLGLGRFGHQNVDAQAIAVLHEHMPAVAQFRRLAVAFLMSRESGSVVLWWVAFERFSPLKSTIPVPSPPSFGGFAIPAFEAL